MKLNLFLSIIFASSAFAAPIIIGQTDLAKRNFRTHIHDGKIKNNS